MSDNYCWSTIIKKMMLWRYGNWEKVENNSNFFIKVHFDQIVLTMEDKVIESLNINNKIKCVYKDDVVILIASNATKEVRKIKFQISSNPKEFLGKLAQYFPVTCHSTKETVAAKMQFQKLDEIFKQVLLTNDTDSALLTLPPEYPSFIKLCLLDPNFNNFLKETEQIITSIMNK